MNKKKIVKKKIATTHDQFIKSMTKTQKAKYDEGYHDFLLSELLIAIIKNDAIAVRELAKAAGISTAVTQKIRPGAKQNISTQSFFKILQELGCSLVVTKDKHTFPMEFTSARI